MSMKNPLTLAGIEPATFRFVAQHLNHCATAVPSNSSSSHKVRIKCLFFFCWDKTKLEFSKPIVVKPPNVKLHEVHVAGAEFHADGRADEHYEASSRFSQLCVHA